MHKKFAILFVMLLGSMFSLFADDAVEVPAAGVATDPAEALTQGQAAVLLVNKLGLWKNARPPSAADAAAMLSSAGITPFAGWVLDDTLSSNDLARMLVQAVGKVGEIPEGERDNAATTAYKDYLLQQYNLEIPETVATIVVAAKGSGTGTTDGDQTSDPLEGSGAEGDNPPFITETDFLTAITAIVPSQGGGSTGQVDSGTVNTTPSSPSVL